MHQNNINERIDSMKKNYNELFQIEIDKYEGLELDIINSLNRIRNRNIRARQSIFTLISIISLFGLVFSGKYLIELFNNSGVYDYISLIISNTDVLNYWKELSYSIVESIPFMELSIVMCLISVLIWSLRQITKIQIINNYGTKITY